MRRRFPRGCDLPAATEDRPARVVRGVSALTRDGGGRIHPRHFT
ncbi:MULTISPECIES: hypothetical protein [unclassified Streptosporangium]|nr:MULTISPECIES: hypothetical protein [unclassified Streptosporangium]